MVDVDEGWADVGDCPSFLGLFICILVQVNIDQRRLMPPSGPVAYPLHFAKILDPPLEDAGKTSVNPGQ